ncbi:hypothetical protein JCM6882_006417 [Rhodosporidiobolus microsporus]
MSHLADAPFRPRRHSDAAYDNLKKRKTYTYGAPAGRDALNDSTLPSSSSSSSSSRPLKVLLLPAQLEIRRLSERRAGAPSGPKRFSTDSSFHLRQLLPRQSTSTQAQIDQALSGVTASSDCREIVTSYEGSVPAGQLRRYCYQAVAEARDADEAASSSSSRAAAATRTRTRTTTARLETITLSSAPTGQVAAPITSLNPSEALASAVNSRFSAAASAASSVAAASSLSRASIQASVDSLFSQAASEVSSRRVAATASSTASSAISSSSIPSTSSSLPSSTSSATPSSTSSSADPSATAAPAQSGNNRNLARIVAPAVIVPVVVLLLLLLAFCLWRRKRRRASAGAGGLPSISNPQPLRAAPRAYGAAGAGAGTAALAGAGAAAAAGRGAGDSQESFGTTPSAIGVAFSEPRTRWGRRSLVDVLAGGVRGASTPSNAPTPTGSTSAGSHSRNPTYGHAGRQPSISSVASEYRGVGGYNSHTGYQPGQMRPVVSPLAHYDPFGPGSIVAVPAAAQRHHPSSSESSQSGYGEGEGSARSRSTTAESLTAQLAPPLAGGYAHAPIAQQSRTTQTSGEGYDGYYTADPGFTSSDSFAGEDDDAAEMLSDEGFRGSPGEEAAVNFGSGSSGSGSGSRSGSHEDPQATPRVGSAQSTPRLGVGHGSGIGVRRNDGTGSWWN